MRREASRRFTRRRELRSRRGSEEAVMRRSSLGRPRRDIARGSWNVVSVHHHA